LRPAAYCGVVGYKPSYGAIPRTGVYAVAHSLDHIGVFTRNVMDAALLASSLFGQDGVDVTSIPAIAPPWPLQEPDAAPRIALLHLPVWDRVSREQQELVDAVARLLELRGAIVTQLELPPSFGAIWKTAQTICDVEGAVVNSSLAAETPPRISQATLDLVARGKMVMAVDYARAKSVQAALIKEFAAIMSPFDAALTAPALGEAPFGLQDTGDAAFCTPGSLLGAPAITIPAGTSANKLPLGVQLLGYGSSARSAGRRASRWSDPRLRLRPRSMRGATRRHGP
jgi:Asp-tRNA(Asn)/Glu-tRNA(Gln) amidotransferase A subunit family amidase